MQSAQRRSVRNLSGKVSEKMSELPQRETAAFAERTALAAIRPARQEDLARIAEIYKSQFCMPGTLLGRMSAPLIAALCGAFPPALIFLVHTTDGAVDGFVLGGTSRATLQCRMSFFLRHPLLCIVNVAFQPGLWRRAYRAFVRTIGGWISSTSEASSHDRVHMLSIAVAADALRRGIGTALVQKFEAAIVPQSQTYSLHVLKNNAAAIRFYEKLGLRVVAETANAWKLRKVLATQAGAPESSFPTQNGSHLAEPMGEPLPAIPRSQSS